ncbi:MAG: hypothetical protein ACPGVP_08510 [Thiolinea sp.]
MSRFRLLFFLFIVLVLCKATYAEEETDAVAKAKETASLAKIAKSKAEVRFQKSQLTGTERSPLQQFDTQGCDINIGNVALDGLSDSPEEINIIIDGDIIQSNNCR